jgi:dienelactone hydrolase
MQPLLISKRNLILAVIMLASACAPNPSVEAATPFSSTAAASETPSFSSRPTLTGEWIGAVKQPDGATASVQIHFDDSGTTLSIEPRTESWKINLTQENESVQFSLTDENPDPFKQIEFIGTFKEGVFSGEFSWDRTTSTVYFTPIATVDKSIFEKYEGLYQFESGRSLSILVSPEYSWNGLQFFSQALMMTDFDSGALRGLYPFDDYTFAVGALRVVGTPFAGRIQFITDEQGTGTGLMWWDAVDDISPSSTSGQFAKRVQYKQEEISFTSADGTKLAGRLSLPESNSTLPAFMMVHGSEPGTRDNFGNKVMAHYMISHGFVVLNYDKRGVGDSEGTYQESASSSNLQKHAEDAIAGVEYLASRSEIDAKRIGLIGFSQAGWVIPIAASQSAAVTHIVVLSGPVASPEHERLFSSYTNDGETITDYDDAKITQQLREVRSAAVMETVPLDGLTQPGLWLWGSVDKSVPVTFSVENLQNLIDLGEGNFSYKILPMGDHNLNESPRGLFAEIPYSPRVLFYSVLDDWLEANMAKEQ